MGALEGHDQPEIREEIRPPFSIIEPGVDPAPDPDDLPTESSPESDGVEIPVVMPGRRGSSIWQRHARKISRVAVAVLVLTTAWVLYGRVAREGTDPPSAFSSIEEAPVTEEMRSIDQAFATAVSRYRERVGDFELGRLGCEGLWTGYRAVDETFMSLTEQYSMERGEAADRLYEGSKRSMEEVERHFQSSECPRGG